MKKTIKNLLPIVLSLFICLALVQVASPLYTNSYSTIFSLQFEGIDRGLNPDGTRFNASEIISEDALKFVAKSSDIEYNPAWLDSISMKSMLPRGIVKTIQEKRVESDGYTYFPNEFKIVMSVNEENGVSKEIATKLMENYKIGYEQYFIDKYSYPYIDLSYMIGYFDYSQYDYPELTKVFDNQINMVLSYLTVLANDDPEFVASNGSTFNDVRASISTAKNIELAQINSVVNAYKLTKDKEELLLKYAYMIRRYELEFANQAGSAAASEDALSLLEGKESSVVLPSGGDAINLDNSNSTYNALAEQTTNSKINAENKAIDKAYIEQKMNELSASTPIEPEYSQAITTVDGYVKGLEAKIEKWVRLEEEMSAEYFHEKYANSVALVQPMEPVKMGLVMKLALIIVLWFASLTILFAIRTRKKKQLWSK